ncbi:MAG TPA: TIGR03089 family protein [Egibacteraceae bacterium]|nr:TIGR03089 family protein [Egibacteraceae bacterium]
MTEEPDSGGPEPASSLADLSAAVLRRRGHAPFLTFYDDSSGERTEFSYATFDNWVAKTANFLVEEFDVGAGHRVVAATGTHWTTAVIAFACWRAGACLAPVPSAATDQLASAAGDPTAAAVFVEESALPAFHQASAAAGTLGAAVVAVGAGLGARLTTDGGDVLSFGEEVPAFADHFDAVVVPRDAAALAAGAVEPAPAAESPAAAAQSLTMAELLGATAATRTGLASSDRLLAAGPLHTVEGLILGCLAPFAAGASVVLVRNLDAGTLERKLRDERVTLALLETRAAHTLDASAAGPQFRGDFVASI